MPSATHAQINAAGHQTLAIGIILAAIYFVMVYRRFAGKVSASSDEHGY